MKQVEDYQSRNGEILRLYKSGKIMEEISNSYGITRSRVQQIVQKEFRKELQRYSNVTITNLETKRTLKLAVHNEIKDFVKTRNQKKYNQHYTELKKKLDLMLPQIPPPKTFLSVSEFARAVDIDLNKLSKFFPELVREIVEAKNKKWSRHYNKCKICGTSSVKHQSLGYCENCYTKSEEFKSYQRASFIRNIEKRRKKNNEYIKKYNKRPEIIAKKKKEWDLKNYDGNRLVALQRDRYCCQFCGLTQDNSYKKYHKDLFVFHVDKNIANNELSNLISLCKKCFAKSKIITKTKLHGKKATRQKNNNTLTVRKLVVNDAGASNLINEVSKYYKINPKKLLGTTREKEYAVARQLVMYILREKNGLSYPKIAHLFHRDHTTAMHSYKKIKESIKSNSRMSNDVENLSR